MQRDFLSTGTRSCEHEPAYAAGTPVSPPHLNEIFLVSDALQRAAWGHGYATEAARPRLDHALHTLGLPEVVVDIDPANTASVGVARKLGMRPSGRVLYAVRTVTRYVARTAGVSP